MNILNLKISKKHQFLRCTSSNKDKYYIENMLLYRKRLVHLHICLKCQKFEYQIYSKLDGLKFKYQFLHYEI